MSIIIIQAPNKHNSLPKTRDIIILGDDYLFCSEVELDLQSRLGYQWSVGHCVVCLKLTHIPISILKATIIIIIASKKEELRSAWDLYNNICWKFTSQTS